MAVKIIDEITDVHDIGDSMNTNNTLGDNLIELKNVCKNYKDFSLNCSLEIKRGTVTGLIGKNGAGKTTVFKALLGLIRIDSGSIVYKGEERKSLSETERERIGVVLAESFISAYLNASDVRDILSKAYRTFDKQKFEAYCRRFDIPMKKRIKEYSTGMKAKLKLISALCHETELLILDEPTAGLDVVARDELITLLRDYMLDENHSIIVSSHISSDLEGLCDDIYMIDNGEVILHEDTDTLFDEYGIIKISDKDYPTLNKDHIRYVKQESFGYRLLTDCRSFYMDNYPGLIIEKSSIDDIILVIISGQKHEN